MCLQNIIKKNVNVNVIQNYTIILIKLNIFFKRFLKITNKF